MAGRRNSFLNSFGEYQILIDHFCKLTRLRTSWGRRVFSFSIGLRSCSRCWTSQTFSQQKKVSPETLKNLLIRRSKTAQPIIRLVSESFTNLKQTKPFKTGCLTNQSEHENCSRRAAIFGAFPFFRRLHRGEAPIGFAHKIRERLFFKERERGS